MTIDSILISLFVLGVVEAVVKPLVIRATQVGIRDYIFPAYEKLDGLLTIPDNWAIFVNDAEFFIWETIIPDEMEEKEAKKLADYLVANFDIKTFLDKAETDLCPPAQRDI